MDERSLRTLAAAGAISHVRVVANGARFHVEVQAPNGIITAETRQRRVRTWVTLDAAARWVRGLGLAAMSIDLTHWQPQQKELPMPDATDRRIQEEMQI